MCWGVGGLVIFFVVYVIVAFGSHLRLIENGLDVHLTNVHPLSSFVILLENAANATAGTGASEKDEPARGRVDLHASRAGRVRY